MSRLTIQYGQPEIVRLHEDHDGTARYETVREARFRVISAAEAWALMDFNATDGLSVAEMGIDYGWPEPGDSVGTVEGTAQLYWPGVGPECVTTEKLQSPRWDGYYVAPNSDEIPFYRCDGRLICWDCWRPYSEHPCDEREECLTVLCNGWRVKL